MQTDQRVEAVVDLAFRAVIAARDARGVHVPELLWWRFEGELCVRGIRIRRITAAQRSGFRRYEISGPSGQAGNIHAVIIGIARDILPVPVFFAEHDPTVQSQAVCALGNSAAQS